MRTTALLLTVFFAALSCGGRKASTASIPAPATDVPDFCADSAYHYIKVQTDFGPRVPNTDAQVECAVWLMKKLESFGADTYLQGFESVTFDKTKIRCYNVIGSYNRDCPTRIIL